MRCNASSTSNSVSGRGISVSGRNLEIQPEEFALAQNVGDRLALQATLQQDVVGCLLACIQTACSGCASR